MTAIPLFPPAFVTFADGVGEAASPFTTPIVDFAERFTFFQPEWATTAAKELGDSIGFPDDQIRYVLCLFACYPVGLLHAALPTGTLKNLYNLAVGIAMAQFVFGYAWIHTMLSASVCYLIIALRVPSYQNVVMVFMMAYISCSHISRLYVDYLGWTLDFTGAQMVLTIKMTSIAYNIFDGSEAESARLKAEIKRCRASGKPKDKKKADNYEDRLHRSLDGLPSLLEFFAFAYNPYSALAGPAFEAGEYLRTVRGQKDTSLPVGKFTPDWSGCVDGWSPVLTGSHIFAALKRFFFGIFFMVAIVIGGGWYPKSLSWGCVPGENASEADLEHCGTYGQHLWDKRDDTVVDSPLWYRLVYMWFALFFVRARYFFGWKVSEGGAILAGFGYEGRDKDGKDVWGGEYSSVRQMDVLGFEFAESIPAGTKAWNQATQSWLQRYVYFRTNESLYATYFVSAFWHGFYPGYYLFFLSVPLATHSYRVFFKNVRPHFVNSEGKESKVYTFFMIAMTWLQLNYHATVFQALDWRFATRAWAAVHYCFHIFNAFVAFVVPILLPAPSKKAKKQ